MKLTTESRHNLAIRSALLKLMAQKPYQEIRINHIAEEASVSRNTFYRCFKNKEQVICEIYDSVMVGAIDYIDEQMEESKSPHSTTDVLYNVLLITFTRYYGNLESSRILLNSGVDDIIYNRFRAFFSQLCGKVVRSQNLQIKDQELIQFLISHMTGSAFHFLKDWLNQPNPPIPERMALLYSQILRPSIQLILELSNEPQLHNQQV